MNRWLFQKLTNSNPCLTACRPQFTEQRFGLLLLSIIYIVSGKLGLMLALPPGYSSPIFPPAGVAVAAAYIGGRRTLPWIFIGSLALNLWVGYSADQQFNALGFMVATVIAVASTLQAALGGWGLRKALGFPASFDKGSEIFLFLVLSPAICLTSASLSVSGLWALGVFEAASVMKNWAAWWVGDTLGVVVMLPLCMIVAGEPRPLWRGRLTSVGFPMLLVFALFVAIFLKANQWEYADSLSEFRQLSQQAVNQIQNKFEEQEFLLEETAGLFIQKKNSRVTRQEFHDFVGNSLNRFSMIQALEWAPRVTAADRDSFEDAQRREVPGFEIRERNAAGEMQPAGTRAAYYPVTYIEPLRGNEPAMGFDLASNLSRRTALNKTIQSGAAIATEAINLVQEHTRQTGVLLLLEVNTENSQSGIVLTVLRVSDFMDKILKDTSPLIHSRLVDLDGKTTLYDNFSQGDPKPSYVQDMIFGTRHYRLETGPTPAYVKQHQGLQSWVVLAAGILGTGLFGALLLLGTGYAARVEAQVEDRTRKLKQSEARFRSIIESSPIPYALNDDQQNITYLNSAFIHTFGYTLEDIPTLAHWWPVAYPDPEYRKWVAATWQARVEHAKLKHSAFEPFEVGIRCKDGAVRTVLAGASLIEIGSETHHLVVLYDITERKQSELALQRASEKNLALLRNASDGIHILDINANLIEASDSFCAMLGYRREEMIGMNLIQWDAGYSGEELEKIFRKQFERPVRSQFETRHRRKDGSVIDVEVSGFPLILDGRQVVFNSSRDITARKLAENNLKLAASVFTHAREGIMITATDGTIIDVNDAFSRITGYGRDEIVGHNPRMLNSGRQGQEFYETMWRDLAESGIWSGEIWNRRKNGEIYAEMLTITAVKDDQGNNQQYVALFSDITPIKEHQFQLEHIAHYDVLTSLPNRVLLSDRLHQAMLQVQRREQRLAVVYLDLDGFKSINDKHGHDAGDHVLMTVAGRMKQALREGDTLARLGGDEFVAVLLDLTNSQSSVPLLTRLLKAAAEPVHFEGIVLQISASLGVTFYPQPEELDADQLLRQADQAMYQAKIAGKNRYHVFDSEQDITVRGHHESLEHIRQGFGNREFVLHFQPKVNMRSGKVVGAEALLRWQHPEKGLLLPAAFLHEIENHPLALEIGEWVIDTALTQMELWHEVGLDVPVSVNVGARQLQQPDFVERLQEILARHPSVRSSDLELEVLETSALEDIARISKVIEDCRNIGVNFALDDFGTGYSSLTYLKRLPVAQLKIDQSFVRDMLGDPDDLAILEGVIGLARAFQRQVIAEGVETIEHGVMLLRLGCELAQGYGIARPMPARQLQGWLNSWQCDAAWVGLISLSRDDLPLLFASVEHRAWIMGVESFLRGERETPPEMDHHRCRFGLWMASEGLIRHGRRSTFQAIEPLHQRVHELAAELMESRAQGKEVLSRLGELHALRDALLEKLHTLLQDNDA